MASPRNVGRVRRVGNSKVEKHGDRCETFSGGGELPLNQSKMSAGIAAAAGF